MSETLVRRARVGGLAKAGATKEALDEAKRDLRVSALEDRIRRIVDNSAPPLTVDQRVRLASILLASPVPPVATA